MAMNSGDQSLKFAKREGDFAKRGEGGDFADAAEIVISEMISNSSQLRRCCRPRNLFGCRSTLPWGPSARPPFHQILERPHKMAPPITDKAIPPKRIS